MKLEVFTFVLTFLFVQIHAAEYHLVAWDNADVNVTLTGKPNRPGRWTCDPNAGDVVTFHDANDPGTNATFSLDGVYSCKFTTSGGRIFPATIRVVSSETLPLMQLSHEFFQELLHLQYHYFVLSHRFLSHRRYLPNVSKFFKGLMKTASDTSDTVVKYVLAKYVTTSALDGSNPPNYQTELLEKGFATDLQYPQLDITDSLEKGFQQAFDMEKQLVSTLTNIGQGAVEFDDHELEEFVVADLIPPMLVRLKMLSNHIYTVRGITQRDASLGEFLYDRQLS